MKKIIKYKVLKTVKTTMPLKIDYSGMCELNVVYQSVKIIGPVAQLVRAVHS